MILDKEKIERVRKLLKFHSKGLTISDISHNLKMNRNIVAKYLEILLITGQVEMQPLGTAKVYHISKRTPISGMLKFASEMMFIVNDALEIIQANEAFYNFFLLTPEDVIGKITKEISSNISNCLEIEEYIGSSKEGGLFFKEIEVSIGEKQFYLKIRCIPTVFDDGGEGHTFIIENITLERTYRERLRLNEARYRAIVEDQTDLVCRFTSDGTLTFVNPAASGTFFLPDNPVEDKKFFQFIPSDEIIRVKTVLSGLSHDTPVVSIVHKNITTQSGERWYQWVYRRIEDHEGNFIEFQSAGRDITEAKRNIQELKLRDTAIETSANGIFILNERMQFHYINTAFIRLFGYLDKKEIIGITYEEFLKKHEGIENILATIKDTFKDKGCWIGKITTSRSDGEIIHATVSINRFIDEVNGGRWVSGSVIDLTETIQMKSDLKKAYGKLQETIEYLPDPTFIVDYNNCVVAWNRALETFTGVGKDEILGTDRYKNALNMFLGHRPILVDLLALNPVELAKEYPWVSKMGDSLFIETFVPSLGGGKGAHIWGKASPLIDSDGILIGAIEIIRDISNWKKIIESQKSAFEKINCNNMDQLENLENEVRYLRTENSFYRQKFNVNDEKNK